MLRPKPKKVAMPPPTGQRRARKPRTTSVREPDTTTFPFLKLPGEVRNMIYAYVLIDPDYAIRFEANTSPRDSRSIVRRLYRAAKGPPDRDDLPAQAKGSVTKACRSYKSSSMSEQQKNAPGVLGRFKSIPSFPQAYFATALLQTCRQIDSEAAPIFYGANMFAFEAVPHMYAFLTHFQPRLPLVRKLGVASVSLSLLENWRGPPHLAQEPLHNIFPLLAQATTLEALYFNWPILMGLARRPQPAAKALFEQGHVWMHALGKAKGNALAVLDVLKMPVERSGQAPKWCTDEEGQAEFRDELAGRLTVV
ncbi:hypothetical protein DE146DRAFT_38159 [Phaeosphaeria sp. MPI-PUGE-AT-0046c]|nr:hypothetical protein DE146DRAFT_38159 [Phaeosphaeria sp. MPI-PUGE-AT-0046c]